MRGKLLFFSFDEIAHGGPGVLLLGKKLNAYVGWILSKDPISLDFDWTVLKNQ
jgi:hypothetical protein